MAKLEVNAAGINAGESYAVKMTPVESIIISPRISRIFRINDETLRGITEKMVRVGFDHSEPLALWKHRNILVDGHTRLFAAKEAGLAEVPAVEIDFADEEEAMLYCIERQRLRRNLTQQEIMLAARLMQNKGNKDGSGSAAEKMAKRIGVSRATITRARKIIAEAPLESLAIDKGEKTINEVYRTLKKPKPKPEPVPPPLGWSDGPASGEGAADASESDALPPSIAPHFLLLDQLRKAVSFLVGKGELNAAELLVGEFVPEAGREEFLASLSVEVRGRLLQRNCNSAECNSAGSFAE